MDAAAPKLFKPKEFSEKHPSVPIGTLRDIIFKSKPRNSSTGSIPGNGFDRAIVRLNGSVLIDEKAFFECLEDHNRQRGGTWTLEDSVNVATTTSDGSSPDTLVHHPSANDKSFSTVLYDNDHKCVVRHDGKVLHFNLVKGYDRKTGEVWHPKKGSK